MPATPRRSKRFGGSAAHQRLLLANLAASLFAAEGIVTTEAKAKALRPIAEKLITKAKKAQEESPMRVHRIRQIQGYLGDKEMTNKLVNEVAPRYTQRNGGYTRILKLGERHGDNAPMARIELVSCINNRFG
jgi:large subunit ribosomal protein L17